MRRKRLKAPPNAVAEAAYYHCTSRVVNREFVLGPEEREQFLRLMRIYERLCGVRVATFCIMSNHFHLLVAVPKKPNAMPTNAELIATVRASLGDLEAQSLEHDLALAGKTNSPGWEDKIRERYLRRMWDISLFMKTLKQRFTQWFNKRHKRKGTLWEDRFRSVLVQSGGEPLAAMAAYIDLNPVRALMAEDPKDYRWCGYGAAMGGDAQAQAGMAEIERMRRPAADEPEPKQPSGTRAARKADDAKARLESVLAAYRVLLHGRGEERGVGEDGRALRKGVSRDQVKAVVEAGGRISRRDYLRCRVRYFTDGAVFGSRDYVNQVFGALRDRFGERRKTGARPLHGLAKDEKLYALRDLKVELIT